MNFIKGKEVLIDQILDNNQSNSSRLPKIKEFVDKNDPGAMIIPFSGAFEAKFLEMDEDGRKALIEETKCNR